MSEHTTIATVGIIGAGLMGTGIAEVAAAAGHRTILVKATPGTPDDARARVVKSLARQVERGKLSIDASGEILARLTVTDELAALADCDLVIECVVEDLAIKRELFARLDRLVKPSAIFATNTSTLKVAEIASGLDRAARTIGLHFFSPVPAMKLVELAHVAATDDDALAAAEAFVGSLGKTAVKILDSTGFIVNRLLVPYLLGAIAAFEDGLASPQELDTAMRLGCGHPMGPLGLADAIGLDIVLAMAKLLHREFRDPRYAPPAILSRLVERQELGKKSKRGFYDYTGAVPRGISAPEKAIERDAA